MTSDEQVLSPPICLRRSRWNYFQLFPIRFLTSLGVQDTNDFAGCIERGAERRFDSAEDEIL
jgi:hypothetical protein